MKNSTAILATVALGAVLAVGAATASMARGGGGGGGHMGGGGGGGHMGGGGSIPFIMNHGGGSFGGGRSFGGHPFVMNHGGGRGFGMRHGFNGDHGFGRGRPLWWFPPPSFPRRRGRLLWVRPILGARPVLGVQRQRSCLLRESLPLVRPCQRHISWAAWGSLLLPVIHSALSIRSPQNAWEPDWNAKGVCARPTIVGGSPQVHAVYLAARRQRPLLPSRARLNRLAP